MNVFTLPRSVFAGGLLALALVPAVQDAKPAAPAPRAPEAAPKSAKLNEKAPDFTLKNLAGEDVTLSKLLDGKTIVVLEWFNPDCPVSRAYHEPEHVMGDLAASFAEKNVVWLAINSGAPGKQGAGAERNVKAVEEFKIAYPVLLDESGTVGHLYAAKTTPHMYVIDTAGVLRYAGAIDDGSGRAKGEVNYVRQALEELQAGKPVSKPDTRAFGCSVKYAD